jgi:hypothetical protein
VQAEVASARRDWGEGYRRLLEETPDPTERERALREVDVVVEELRKRIGGSFTLAELAHVYVFSQTWAREAIAERTPSPGWPHRLAFVGDAAFHLYSRGALDYAP